MLTPIAANTMAKFSSEWSSTSFFLTKLACLQICAPMSLWGKPYALKRGIFWPLTILFIVSMAEMPVCNISLGYSLWVGLIGSPMMSSYSSAKIGGPLSIGLPEPLKVRPSISQEIGILSTSPVNSQNVSRLSMPLVPSNIWTIAFLPLISSTCPLRLVPSPSVTFTISAYLGNFTSSRMTKGPSTPINVD